MQHLPLPLDPYTTLFVIGLLYTVMPLTVWTVLSGRHEPRTTALWCAGALLSGVNFVLVGLRVTLPPLVTLHLANSLGFIGFAMRWAALRRERGRHVPALRLAALVLLCIVAYTLAAAVGLKSRLVVSSLILAASAFGLAREAGLLARLRGSRSAGMVAVTYGLLAAAALFRTLVLLLTPDQPVAFDFTVDVDLILFAGVLSALWGNLGYLGVAIEAAQQQEAQRRVELAAATARGEQALRQATALKALSDERQELLRVISHEVRQPLHNAQAVLQGVEGALHPELAEGEAAAARFARARRVLRQITDSLDNTLAVSTLLVEGRAAPLRDADVQLMVELCLGDLPPAGRARVRVVYDADVRTAAMDVGLMRLALRNLLNNAIGYSLPGSPVTLRVADSDEPLLLSLEVIDQGPPISAELLPRLFERGTRGRLDLPGQGLGLYIVQQAMLRQGGRVDIRVEGGGNCFVLSLPQGVEPA